MNNERKYNPKLELMRLKLHAKGDTTIPKDQRVYFRLVIPGKEGEAGEGIYFNREWSVGRAIDHAATRFSLQNKNNDLKLVDMVSRWFNI
jgi:hypothetical protein